MGIEEMKRLKCIYNTYIRLIDSLYPGHTITEDDYRKIYNRFISEFPNENITVLEIKRIIYSNR